MLLRKWDMTKLLGDAVGTFRRRDATDIVGRYKHESGQRTGVRDQCRICGHYRFGLGLCAGRRRWKDDDQRGHLHTMSVLAKSAAKLRYRPFKYCERVPSIGRLSCKVLDTNEQKIYAADILGEQARG